MSAHQLPLAEIKFASKNGFLPFGLWNEYFANGDYSWRLRQWKALMTRGYFKKHPSSLAEGVYVLNPRNPLVQQVSPEIISPPYISQLVHDEVVSISLLKLQNKGLISGYRTEGELKSRALGTNKPKSPGDRVKFPDALIHVGPNWNYTSVAVELELTRKDYKRYLKIIRNYATRKYADMIIFIGTSEGMFEALRRAMRENSYPTSTQPIGFVSCEKWKSAPETAPIHFSFGTTSLNEIYRRQIQKLSVTQTSTNDELDEANKLIASKN